MGLYNNAEVAGPVSPPKPGPPEPAIVLILCVASTIRMRWLLVSAMSMLPAVSKATSYGKERFAEVAAPPSPVNNPKLHVLPQMGPVPATVLITPTATL